MTALTLSTPPERELVRSLEARSLLPSPYAPQELRLVRACSRSSLLVMTMLGAYWNMHRPQDELSLYRLHQLYMEVQTTPMSTILERAEAGIPIRSPDTQRRGTKKKDHSKEWAGDIGTTAANFDILTQLGVIRTKKTKPDIQVTDSQVALATAAALREVCAEIDITPGDCFAKISGTPSVVDPTTQRARIYQTLVAGQRQFGDDFSLSVAHLAERLGVNEGAAIHNYLEPLASRALLGYQKDKRAYSLTGMPVGEETPRMIEIGRGFFTAVYKSVLSLPPGQHTLQEIYDVFVQLFKDTYKRETLIDGIGSALYEMTRMGILKPHLGVSLPPEPQMTFVKSLVDVMDASIYPTDDFVSTWFDEAQAFLESPQAVKTFLDQGASTSPQVKRNPSMVSTGDKVLDILAAQADQPLTLSQLVELARNAGLMHTPKYLRRALEQAADRGIVSRHQIKNPGEREQRAWMVHMSPQLERSTLNLLFERRQQATTLDDLQQLFTREGLGAGVAHFALDFLKEQGLAQTVQRDGQAVWELTPKGKAYEYGRRILQHGVISSSGDFYFGDAADQFITRHSEIQRQVEQSIAPITRFTYDNETWLYIRDGKRLSDRQDEDGEYQVAFTKELLFALQALRKRLERSSRR